MTHWKRNRARDNLVSNDIQILSWSSSVAGSIGLPLSLDIQQKAGSFYLKTCFMWTNKQWFVLK